MLDDLSLADKTRVARGWFRGVRLGEFTFTAATARSFEDLLETIEEEASQQLDTPTRNEKENPRG